ncbi:DedA family protein [Pseudomonas citronellolis]|uniref:DedA family protein n=1 Tax=Pseudomonas citronellolis TaxID=53408 RepID=UPI0023E3BA7A|nr:DedA family protein [Pseudomonas citronellolis]MDF3933972.1 DedA family protein [Pseudomonas citronellolis]
MPSHPDLSHLLADYGYWAVLVGCLLEGESLLLLAGLAVHQGLLKLWPVLGCAMLGGLLGDQALYWVGRRGGSQLLPRLRRQTDALQRLSELIGRHPFLAVFAVRFLYGMRLAGPLAIGASGVPPGRFLLANLLGAGAWALLFCGAGYWAGNLLERLLGDLRPYRLAILGGVALLALGVALLLRWRRARRERAAGMSH